MKHLYGKNIKGPEEFRVDQSHIKEPTSLIQQPEKSRYGKSYCVEHGGESIVIMWDHEKETYKSGGEPLSLEKACELLNGSRLEREDRERLMVLEQGAEMPLEVLVTQDGRIGFSGEGNLEFNESSGRWEVMKASPGGEKKLLVSIDQFLEHLNRKQGGSVRSDQRRLGKFDLLLSKDGGIRIAGAGSLEYDENDSMWKMINRPPEECLPLTKVEPLLEFLNRKR